MSSDLSLIYEHLEAFKNIECKFQNIQLFFNIIASIGCTFVDFHSTNLDKLVGNKHALFVSCYLGRQERNIIANIKYLKTNLSMYNI